MSDPLVDVLVQPLVALRGLLGQTAGVTAGVTPLRAASAVVETAAGNGRAALAALDETWHGAAADAAGARIAAVPTVATTIANRGTAMATVIEQAATDMGVARTRLDQIVGSFRAAADKLAPVLHTPPGRTNILDAARDHMSRALEVMNTIRANLDAHMAALRALAPAVGEVPPPIGATPAAPAPAVRTRSSGYRDADIDRETSDRMFDDDSPRMFDRDDDGYREAGPVPRAMGDLAQVASAAIGAGAGEVENLLSNATQPFDTPAGMNAGEHDPIHPGPAHPAPNPSTPPPADAIIMPGHPTPAKPGKKPAKPGGKAAPKAKPAKPPTPGPVETPTPVPHAAAPVTHPTPNSTPGPTSGPAAPHSGGQAGVTTPTTPTAPTGRAADRTDHEPVSAVPAPATGGQAGVTAPPPGR